VASPAAAQTLDLDGVRQGPTIAAENGALDLAAALEEERLALEVAARTLRGEALASAQARMRLRQVAIALLQSGANRPWSESGPVVLGLRVANLLRGADAAIEAAAAGRRLSDGRPLPREDARVAVDALRSLGAMPLDRLQGAMRRDAANPARVIETLAQVLAPVATVLRVVEETETLDPWPLLATSTSASDAPAAARDTLESLRARIAALRTGSTGPRGDLIGADLLGGIESTLEKIGAAPLVDRALLHGVASAVRVSEWVVAVRSLPLPRPIEDSVIERVESQVSRAVDSLARLTQEWSDPSQGDAPDAGSGASTLGERSLATEELTGLEAVVDACDGMLALRKAQGSSELARRALSEAIAALVVASESGPASARNTVGAATRISEACSAAERLEKGAAGDSPREFREVVRALDRDARIAVRALPDACRTLAADPAQVSDPGALAPLTRVLTLDADRTRIVALQGLIARISAVRPKAAQGIEGSTRRLARMLLDPIKRADAQRGFGAVEGLAGAAFPLPFEDELLRRTERAAALTGGAPDRVLDVAAQARAAWAEAVGRGDLGGPDAVWLDEVARFFAAMRDLSALAAPVTRDDADRLALWGGWTARRALISPATVDLDARAILAARSLVASTRSGDRTEFRRDLASLERAIPLVRLVSRLERTVVPLLESEPSSTAAMLAPLVHTPRSDAAFAREWPRLLMLDRALLESEFARRKGAPSTRDDLAAFMADLARDIEVGAFGAPVSVGAVPGFDGTAVDGATEGKSSDARPTRRR
jgi:hypothetical protein